MDENSISQETAEEHLAELFDYYELVPEDLPEQISSMFNSIHKKLIKAIRKGRVEIGESGSITQHLKKPSGDINIIEYRELDGRAKKAMQKCNSDDLNGRLYELLGALSGLGSRAIASLKGVDLSTAECIGFVFMSV